jgi:hypothetical protein
MVLTLKHDFPLRFKTGSKSHIDYPFRKMLIGESFLVLNESGLLSKVRIAQKVFEKANPTRKFKEEPATNGIRIWRRK